MQMNKCANRHFGVINLLIPIQRFAMLPSLSASTLEGTLAVTPFAGIIPVIALRCVRGALVTYSHPQPWCSANFKCRKRRFLSGKYEHTLVHKLFHPRIEN